MQSIFQSFNSRIYRKTYREICCMVQCCCPIYFLALILCFMSFFSVSFKLTQETVTNIRNFQGNRMNIFRGKMVMSYIYFIYVCRKEDFFLLKNAYPQQTTAKTKESKMLVKMRTSVTTFLSKLSLNFSFLDDFCITKRQT